MMFQKLRGNISSKSFLKKKKKKIFPPDSKGEKGQHVIIQ